MDLYSYFIVDICGFFTEILIKSEFALESNSNERVDRVNLVYKLHAHSEDNNTFLSVLISSKKYDTSFQTEIKNISIKIA